MNSEQLKKVSKIHSKTIQYINTELKKLNDKLINNDPENYEKFMASMVEATFIDKAFYLSQKAFSIMIHEIEKDETVGQKPLDHWFKKAMEVQEIENDNTN